MQHLPTLIAAATATLLLGACGSMKPMASTMAMKPYDQTALPAAVQVPAGHQVVLETVGAGDITYECKAKADMSGHEWVFVGPMATLKDRSGKAVGSYFGPPATWKANDGSAVTGLVFGRMTGFGQTGPLAQAAGQDPYEFRRGLLGSQPRYKGVLEAAAQKAGWGRPLPSGVFRGIAVGMSFVILSGGIVMPGDVLGYLSLHLHAHLPFVRHPEFEDFLEEDWLYEAISETYLPLLKVFDQATDEGIPFRISLTMSPPLVAMLRDELLLGRYARRLDKLCDLADREVHRTRNDPTFHGLAQHYRHEFNELRSLFHDRYRRDLVAAFRRLEEAGRLELKRDGRDGYEAAVGRIRDAWNAILEHDKDIRILGEALEDPRLREFYRRLAQSEAGHERLFVDLARDHAGGIDVDRRLAEMADEEAAVVAGLPLLPRIH